MLGNAGIYAGKKRRKPVQKPKKIPGVDGVIKSNPSKRHRDRLNGELDRLTDLLPFSEEVRSRLDKLSVLRLSVGYLKVKSFFKVAMKKNGVPVSNGQNMHGTETPLLSEGDLLLKALNGFVIVITAEGLIFYVSPTIQEYLGFHQSDVIHQSVYELIHTDDRALFKQQLHFALNPPPFGQEQGTDVALPTGSDTLGYDPQQLPPENSSFLERSFVCRFRCLLDNSSGFLALKFQGRLKFLHGQNNVNENGICLKPQLALFAFATPVQPPAILEIRAKTVIFQTKHKLDFTPMCIDNRGKVVLGYSETELCMKGSGYQFIHAADMMYCADNHLRMMKTGESGLTVFRLLTKSCGWVWVQANAKLIFKGGRPDFIIARQRALVDAEGEEHFRQRRLQLPFSFTTGEAMLYESGFSMDPPQVPPISEDNKNTSDLSNMDPKSLLDCFLKQDKMAYTQNVESQLPEDQVFMESRALVSVPSNSWQVMGPCDNAGSSLMVKAEGDEAVLDMIDALGKITQDKDLCSALEGLDVDPAELMELENTLEKLSQDTGTCGTSGDFDSILSSEIFTYMENVLFKDSSEGDVTDRMPSCLQTVNNNHGENFAPLLQPSSTGLCEPSTFQRQSFDHIPVKPPSSEDTTNGLVNTVAQPGQLLNSTQKLSHYGPIIALPDKNNPAPQPLQLNNIFSPSIDLPELNIPDNSDHSPLAPFTSFEQLPVNPRGHQAVSGQNGGVVPCVHHGVQATMASVVPLHGPVQPNHRVAPSAVDPLPSLIPCNGFPSPPVESNAHNAPNPFPNACLQGNAPFQAHNNLQVQQWPQDQSQKLPPASMMQNGPKPTPACHNYSESQRVPPAVYWTQNINGLNHLPQGGLANGQHAMTSSCMFEKSRVPPSSSRVDGTRLALSVSSNQERSNATLHHSPPQGSCYFQWGRSEPVVGTSVICQENVSISPQCLPILNHGSSPEDLLTMQHYLECSEQTQIPTFPAENNSLFSISPVVDGNMYFPEQTQTKCCNF